MNFLRTQSLQRVADILKLKLDGVLWKTQSTLNIKSGRNIAFSQVETKDTTTLTITAGKNGVLGYWGSFYDTTTQTVTSTTQAYIIGLNSSDPDNDGVVVTEGSKIYPTTPGVYNISFSVQVSNSDTQINDASFWYRKNGTDLPYSASILSIPNKHGGVNGRIIFHNPCPTLITSDWFAHALFPITNQPSLQMAGNAFYWSCRTYLVYPDQHHGNFLLSNIV